MPEFTQQTALDSQLSKVVVPMQSISARKPYHRRFDGEDIQLSPTGRSMGRRSSARTSKSPPREPREFSRAGRSEDVSRSCCDWQQFNVPSDCSQRAVEGCWVAAPPSSVDPPLSVEPPLPYGWPSALGTAIATAAIERRLRTFLKCIFLDREQASLRMKMFQRGIPSKVVKYVSFLNDQVEWVLADIL